MCSRKKHKGCCSQKLPGFDIGKQYTSAIKEHRLERALLACRADIIQCTIWHKSNTEPALHRGGPIKELLKIDINALADYVERLFWLYIQTNRGADWLPVLERLRKNIQHPQWERKIGYFRALSYLGPEGDQCKARLELARIRAITPDEDDIHLLQIYVDLELDEEPFATRLKFIDRILEVSKVRSDALQYRGGKAVQYFLIGDNVTAQRELEEASRLARESESEEPLNDYGRHLLGRVLQMLAWLRNDRVLFKEALGHFNLLLSGDRWTKYGRAMLYREIGDCHKYAGAWTDAEKAYRNALGILERCRLNLCWN